MTITQYIIKNSPTARMGFFLLNDEVYWTVELPWKGNVRKISCIPEGEYECVRRPSTKNLNAGIPDAFEIMNVPGRSDILFAHVGNSVKDILGCSAVGLDTDLKAETVQNSVAAVKSYMKELRNVKAFTLVIKSL